jgi:TRAP-type mannitol/chloroaromatic compound transport system substrate-binding protein
MAHDRYSKDLEVIKSRGVNVLRTPDAVLEAQLKAWDATIAANKDPFFVKVLESQKAWAKRVTPYFFINNLTTAQQETAYKHFFG